MNADAFRHVYAYHFAENRKIWDSHITALSQAQFTQPVDYSQGSVRNQIAHLMDVDTAWFSQLQGIAEPNFLNPEDTTDRELMRQHWDQVEQMMNGYLATLRDEMLFQKPFPDGEDKDLILWQVLLHVINHGTDHRAQVLRILHDLGAKTIYQDYVFYAYEHEVK